jgi:hypothetical protein
MSSVLVSLMVQQARLVEANEKEAETKKEVTHRANLEQHYEHQLVSHAQ